MKRQHGFGIQYQRNITTWKKAYAEGADAAERGLSFHQNPYKSGCSGHDGWSRGWKAAAYNREVSK